MTQVASLDPKRHSSSQPLILEALEKLEKRHLLPVIELAIVAVFVLVIAFDSRRERRERIAADATPPSTTTIAEQSVPKVPVEVPIAIDRPPMPQAAKQDLARLLIPIVPPSVYRSYPAGSSAEPAPAPQAAALTAPIAPPPATPDKSTAPVAANSATQIPSSTPALQSLPPSAQPAPKAMTPVIAPSVVPAPVKDATITAAPAPKPADVGNKASAALQPAPNDRATTIAPIVPTVAPSASMPPVKEAPIAAAPAPKPADAGAKGAAALQPAPVERAATSTSAVPSVVPNVTAPPVKDATIAPAAKPDLIGGKAPPAATPTITEARLHPEDQQKAPLPDALREQKDFADAFLSASRMLERRLTPEERAASMGPDYVDAIQRIEGLYDPTRVGPFGAGLRMQIRPGTMSMTDVFGERWTRAYPDPNVHYRVGYHAETWIRPRSHKCEDFWRFRTDYSPVALDKLAPKECARIRSKPESENEMMAESSVVGAPLAVPVFAAPYPGNRMTHDELMAALRARADAAREQLWYSRARSAAPRPAPPKPAAPKPAATKPVAPKPKPAMVPADATPRDAPVAD